MRKKNAGVIVDCVFMPSAASSPAYALDSAWHGVVTLPRNARLGSGHDDGGDKRQNVKFMMSTLNRGTSVGEGAHDRVHIVGPRLAEQILVSMKKNDTDVTVHRVDFLPRTKFIVRTSWYRAKTSHRVEFDKWARLRRKEARLQDALRQRAPIGCKYMFPSVLFHGFIRGVFYIVSQYENALVPINEKTATTHALAGRMYRAVEETVHQLWRLGLAPMRVSPHTFALMPRARSAVVLNYNNIVIMNQPVREHLMTLLSQYTGDVNPNACIVHNFQPGTLEHIWSMFKENTPIWNRFVAQYKSVFVKRFKEDESIDAYMNGLHAKMTHLGAARGGVAGRGTSHGSRRRSMLGGAIRGLVRGRRRARDSNDSNSRSPPLKIRKVATLPDSDGWRPRKHSATWGIARSSNANNANANVTNRARNESSRTVSPYASGYKKSSGNNVSGNDSTAPRIENNQNQNAKITHMIGAQARAGLMLGPNAKESFNADYNVFTAQNQWAGWDQARRDFVIKQEMDKFKAGWFKDGTQSVDEMIAFLESQVIKNNDVATYNASNNSTKARMRAYELDKILDTFVTRGLKMGKYKNSSSANVYVVDGFKEHIGKTWAAMDRVEKETIIQNYIARFKMMGSEYNALLKSDELLKFAIAVFAFKSLSTNTINTNSMTALLDRRIGTYIADALYRGKLVGVMMLQPGAFAKYVLDQLKLDVAASKKTTTFSLKDRNRLVRVGLENRVGFVQRGINYIAGANIKIN